jgi:hypothetical protein
MSVNVLSEVLIIGGGFAGRPLQEASNSAKADFRDRRRWCTLEV